MRECIESVRALLAGETVTYHGDFVDLDGVAIDVVHGERRARDVPIYIGATGERMLELSGEIADGVLLNYLVSPAYNLKALQALERGAARGGRSLDDIDRPQLIVCSLDDDRRVALDAARLLVTQYLGQQPHIMKASGVPGELLDDIASVLSWPATEDQIRAASAKVPDEVVQMITASGTLEECREAVARYCDAGCTCPILYPLGPDVGRMLAAFSPEQS
jgi:5,10-methylenetetrahydromethanopterin reductase